MLIIFSVAGQRTLNYFKMLPIISRGTEHIQIFRMFSAARQNTLKIFQTVSNSFRLKGNQNTNLFCVRESTFKHFSWHGRACSNIFLSFKAYSHFSTILVHRLSNSNANFSFQNRDEKEFLNTSLHCYVVHYTMKFR